MGNPEASFSRRAATIPVLLDEAQSIALRPMTVANPLMPQMVMIRSLHQPPPHVDACQMTAFLQDVTASRFSTDSQRRMCSKVSMRRQRASPPLATYSSSPTLPILTVHYARHRHNKGLYWRQMRLSLGRNASSSYSSCPLCPPVED